VGYKCRRDVDGLQRLERRTVRNLECVDGNCQRDTRSSTKEQRAPSCPGRTREQRIIHAGAAKHARSRACTSGSGWGCSLVGLLDAQGWGTSHFYFRSRGQRASSCPGCKREKRSTHAGSAEHARSRACTHGSREGMQPGGSWRTGAGLRSRTFPRTARTGGAAGGTPPPYSLRGSAEVAGRTGVKQEEFVPAGARAQRRHRTTMFLLDGSGWIGFQSRLLAPKSTTPQHKLI